MVITIYAGYDNTYVMLGSKNEEFNKEWGSIVKIPTSAIYTGLAQITSWCNNELDEECLFEVD